MKKKSRLFILSSIAVAAALTLSSCSAVEGMLDSLKGDRSESVLTTAAPEPLWKTDVQLAGDGARIVEEVNTAVSYIAKDDAFMLAGFDLDSGEEKWAIPAGTGSQPEGYSVSLRLFQDESGTYALNFLDAVDGPSDENGNFYRGHPIQIVNVETGDITHTIDPTYWVGSQPLVCIDDDKGCLLSKRGDVISTLSVSSTGEVTQNPALESFPDFTYVDRIDVDGSFYGEKDGVPLVGRYRDGKLEWTTPLAELGLTDLERSTGNSGYRNLTPASYFFTKDGEGVRDSADADVVVITTRIIDADSIYKVSKGTYSSTALDAKSGEKLWSAEGKLCFEYIAVMCSGESTIKRDTEGVLEWLPADQTAWGFDVMSGEKTWETAVPKMTLYEAEGWKTPPGSSLQVFKSDGSYQLFNVEDGEITEPTVEQTFECVVKGEPYSAFSSSIPAKGLIKWTGNFVAAGCGVDKEDVGVSGFSEAVVIAGSPKPFDAAEGWDVWEKQLRVVSTAEGLVAYEL